MNALCLALLFANPFVGRWDLTVTTPNSTYPGWLEVTEKEGQPVARFQPRSGSVRTVKDVKLEGSTLILTLSPSAVLELTAQGDRLAGTQKRGETAAGQVAGVRAPALKHRPPKAWTDPEPLFNGKDLTGWEADRPAASRWIAKDGLLVNETKGANLRTTRRFDDFKLHIEFNCPENGNSGIFLRGRYEIQIEYEPAGTEDAYHSMGSIYGFLAPSTELPRRAGQWETYDATLVGRFLTLVRNGVTTINNQEIAGITGGAIDSHEAEPGPIYFQGDHTGGLQFRNITVSVPKR